VGRITISGLTNRRTEERCALAENPAGRALCSEVQNRVEGLNVRVRGSLEMVVGLDPSVAAKSIRLQELVKMAVERVFK
jgi:hypothetical protein